MKKCDIIIPIYNAYECVIECIESVIKNTNFDGNRLILIDDKSPDDRIAKLLDKYSKKYDFILYLTNHKNLGFVGTVNRGMKESNNDVLLLNSDTEVTANWLDKIQKCAYSSDNIATVTPLSNNATLASVPKSFEPNDIPNGYTLEEMGKIVEECSFNYYPEIPTGHGFCLYIKRTVLDKVGYFDQESFGKGYGEENDFCFRCFEFGYKHVLCDNTYVLHKESKSFLESKVELIANGGRVLEQKYPDYKKRLDLWVQNRPIDYIGNNIALTIGTQEKRSNIMFVIHDWKDLTNNLGGTTLHAWDLIRNLRDKYNFHIFAPEDGIYKVYSYFKDTNVVIKYPGVSTKMTDLNYYNSDYKRLFSDIIEKYSISYVHIHHMIKHYFDLIDVLENKKIKYMVSLHDFYCQCPLINKLYKNKEYCGEPSSDVCNECLKCVYKKSIDIQSWHHEWTRLLRNAHKIITPSYATKEEIKQVYHNVDISVIEHGIDIKKEKTNLELSEKINDIAFIGAIGYHKGSKILEDFIRSNMIKKCRIHLFGIIDSQYTKNNKHFINHGSYTRDELKNLLKENNIKLICLFSIGPETYSYTMTEAIACGIPIISFDLGAISERVKKYNLGWIIKKTSNSVEVANEIKKVINNKTEYNKKIISINNYKIVTTKEMSKKYKDIYSKEVTETMVELNELRKLMINNNIFSPNVSYSDYSWVFNTLKWRIISKIKIPRKIKQIYRKIRNKK